VIHNTTNALDGGVFSPMKKLIKIHNGFTKNLKLKMVDDYLVSSLNSMFDIVKPQLIKTF